jgi:hypothetical protein
MPGSLAPRPVRGSGRSTPLNIVPEQDIYAPHPECTRCTWVAVSHRRMRLKYISASCEVHHHVRKVTA